MLRLKHRENQGGCFIPSSLIRSSIPCWNLISRTGHCPDPLLLRLVPPDCVEDEEKLDPESEVDDVSFLFPRALLPVASVSSKSLSR